MLNLKDVQKRIETRLQELDRRLHDIEDELDTLKTSDLNDQAIDLEDDEVLEGVGLAAQTEVALLQQALKRIEEGRYGICAECDEPISPARLDAVPYAVLCTDCAATR